jgi:hypothetical protein
MSLEQRYVIKFFHDRACARKEVKGIINEHYGADALSTSRIYLWFNKPVRRGTDFIDIPSPGRPPDEEIMPAFQHELEQDPTISARAIADTLDLGLSTVLRCLHEDLHMLYWHRKWMPHPLSDDEKVKRADLAGNMLETLERHGSRCFHNLLTGDESWMFYAYQKTHEWFTSMEEVEEIA